MNKLLQLNKRLLLIILFCIIFFILLLIIFQKTDKQTNNSVSKSNLDLNYDIVNPRFTINNQNDKISIKAKGGNFLSTEKILLENNVVFKSKKFTLFTEKVVFNQKNQTAESSQQSTFHSKGTSIISEGFKINENGNIINFIGNTTLTLDK